MVDTNSTSVFVPFAAVPDGATFRASIWEKDPADRRRKRLATYSYIKQGCGTVSGWARSRTQPENTRSFSRWSPVRIDASDLRLAVTCLRNAELLKGSPA